MEKCDYNPKIAQIMVWISIYKIAECKKMSGINFSRYFNTL